jgi:Sulfotransferase domain
MTGITSTYRRMRFRNKVLRHPLVVYRHRRLSADDVLLATYPRSGTTWMRFLLYEAITEKDSDFDDVAASIPYVGEHDQAPLLLHGRARLIQTHEKRCDQVRKVLYVVRDPRNVVISQFHHYRRRPDVIAETFDEFFEEWLTGKAIPFGRWDDHVRFWLDSNSAAADMLQVVRYEDLRKDPVGQLESTLRFLGYARESTFLSAVVENNSIERMQEKEDRRFKRWRAKGGDNRFIRSGSVSGWRNELSESQRERISRRFGAMLDRLGYEHG